MMYIPPTYHDIYVAESEMKKRIQEAELKSRLDNGELTKHRSSRKAALVALAIVLMAAAGGVILLYMIG